MPALLIIVSIGSFIMLTNPIYGEVKVLQEEQSAFDNALANSLELQTVRDVLIGKYNQFSSQNVERLDQMIPDSVDNIKLAIEIQQIGEAKGLSVESVQYDPKTGQDSQKTLGGDAVSSNNLFEVFELEIIAKGSYENFIGFLGGIEKSLRIVDIVNIEFSSEGSLLDVNSYTYNIIIKTYRLRD